MENKDFTASILTDATPHTAFEAINNVRGWWTENLDGDTQNEGDEFAVYFGDVHYSRQRLVEVVPDKKVVWLVTDSRLNFLEDKSEWTGTRVVFDISEQGGQTLVTFTHEGLKPAIECYGACSNAWGDYIQNSLRNLINTGKGAPTEKEKAGVHV